VNQSLYIIGGQRRHRRPASLVLLFLLVLLQFSIPKSESNRVNTNVICSTSELKGTVRPDWICMRVVSLKSPLKGHQPLCFQFFIFYLEFLIQLQSYEPLHAKRPLILLLVRFTVCMCSSRDLFRQTVFHKCGRGINCSLDCGLQVKNFNIPQPEPK